MARAAQAQAQRPAQATPAQAVGIPPKQRATATAWLRTLLARSLLRRAANPYLLLVMMGLDDLPASRAPLFDGFLQVLHHRESQARAAPGDAASVPDLAGWLAFLTRLAEKPQHLGPAAQAEAAQKFFRRCAAPVVSASAAQRPARRRSAARWGQHDTPASRC